MLAAQNPPICWAVPLEHEKQVGGDSSAANGLRDGP